MVGGECGFLPGASGISVDKCGQMGANGFHFLPGVGIGVWDAVNDSVQVVVFFDDIEACAEIDIAEVGNVGYPVVHFGNPVRGVDALIFKDGVVYDRGDFLCADFFGRGSHKYLKVVFQFDSTVVQLVSIADQACMKKCTWIGNSFKTEIAVVCNGGFDDIIPGVFWNELADHSFLK